MSKNKKILVIDDDDVIRTSCELTLQKEDMTVESAENGKVGIEKIKAEQYDVVLLDLMMPEITGADVLDFIQRHDPGIIVIVITGFATIESAVDTLKKGAYDYLPKPFTPEELRNVVRKGLERRKLLTERKQLHLERQRNLERIEAEQNRLSTIINCMSEGLIAINKEAKLILKNAVACKLLNIDDACRVGQHVKDTLNNQELENWIIENLKKGKSLTQSVSKEIVFDREQERIYSVTLAPIYEKKNEMNGLVLVITDISEEKKLERMKAEFQKLVSVVTHELKAPINAIEGYLDLIIKGFVKDKPDKEIAYLERSRSKAEKLRSLIQDLLSLTSIESGQLTKEMEPVDIGPIISEILTLMENEVSKKAVTLKQEIPDDLPQVTGDKNALTYLFSNLISNAIKYNKPDGEIEIRVSEEKDRLSIAVKDTGYGIANEELEKIFDEFFRSKNKQIQKISGTGLGLSIAKRIVELHNGDIQVESEEDKGSVFTVTLPLRKSS